MSFRGPLARRLRVQERGAVAIIVAVVVAAVVVPLSGLVLDIGMQRVARRDAQAVADAVALDLVRRLSSDPGSVTDATAEVLAAKSSGGVGNGRTLRVYTGSLVSGSFVSDQALGCGGRSPYNSYFAQTPADGHPDAVLVTVSSTVRYAVMSGSGGVCRSAIASSSSSACFRLGSFAAALNSATSPVLNRYLGEALGVTALSYDGLAGAHVSLLGLATELHAGTVDDLANLTDVSLSRLLLATATVLGREGGPAADVDLLRALSTRVDAAAAVDISDVLELSSAGTSALGSTLDVLDLVGAAAFVANGDHFLDVPVLWNVPQFSDGAADIQVIEQPQLACGAVGEAMASTAQVRFSAHPTLNVPQIDGLTAASAQVDLEVQLANAQATLSSVDCGDGTIADPESIGVTVRRSLASATLSVPLHLSGAIKASDLIRLPSLWGLGTLLSSLLNLKATVNLTVDLGVSVISPAATSTATYAVPPHDYTDPEVVGGAGGLSLPHVALSSSRISGSVTVNGATVDLATVDAGAALDLGPIFNDLVQKNVLTGVNGFIDNVNAQLGPLSELLGLETAGADLYGVPRPVCDQPAIVG